ncbi:carbohydrate ABC transporter permease [Ponticoccus alexandrii]|uniref:ABC transporter permease subunit n=1 Tax=Ponticoccus alexandrii TaxID=1943633 RepID=A0ABX7FG91_9RHOB|nr:sugar ABC transporter permease [Ponticoccus alexandrii]ETA49480.1 sugar ABC transporter permease [Rhodobacteraceae bacterium PD-2]QRF68956.1 ABC transporter permease subunit [Ponticoccus alexandrii]
MKLGRSLPVVFLGPALIVLIILAAVPTLYAFNISLQNRTLSTPDADYVWFANYIALFGDARFLNALWVSLKWEVLTVSATMIVGIGLAIAMFEAATPRWRNVLTLLFIIPVLLPRVCAAFVWKFSFHPLYGAATWPVRAITGETPDILASPLGAMLAVAFVDVWQWGPVFAVIILKLMEALPPQPLEAARIDRCKRWEIHAFITLPMLKLPLISLVLVKAIESLRSFDLVYVMTRGGPGIATETLDMYAYSQGFIEAGKISYASGMAVVMLVLTVVMFTMIWKRLNR